MKASVQIALLAITGVSSLAIEVRDAATIKTVLSNVQTGIDQLDTVVKSYSGGSVTPVVTQSGKLVSTINSGTTTVQGTSPITLSDTIGLITPVQDLKKHAQTLSDDLLAKRSAVEAAKACDTTRTQISNIKNASTNLITAIVSKVPDNAKSIANDQASQVTAVLTQAEANFSTANCTNAA